MSTTAPATTELNGLNPEAVSETIQAVRRDPNKGLTNWGVTTRWRTGCVTETEVDGYEIAGQRVDRRFDIVIDEPFELGGTNTHANPQEHLLAAFNACIAVTYVTLASLHGIELESLEVHTHGEIDLRGLFGLDESVKPGYDQLHYTIRVKGSGTPEQFRQIHETVMKTSPNRWNIAQPIKLTSTLEIA